MVRNAPGEIQRRYLVQRRSSYDVQARLVNVIHGTMDDYSRDPATLIMLEFRFTSLKVSRRIKSATVTLQFEGIPPGNGDDPEVKSIAPDGRFLLKATTKVDVSANLSAANPVSVNSSASYSWKIEERKGTGISLTGMTRLQGRDAGPQNTAVWVVEEDQFSQTGIPSFLQTAVRLQRSSHNKFLARVKIETDVSGFSFKGFQSGLTEAGQDDPIIFDPHLSPMEKFDFDKSELGKLSLQQFVLATTERPTFPTTEEIQQTELIERQTRQEVEALLDSVAPEPKQDLLAPKQPDDNESFYVELWNRESDGSQGIQKVSTLKKDNPQFLDLPSEKLPQLLEKSLLERLFSWMREKQPPPTAEGEQKPQDQSTFCTLIARKSNRTGFTTFQQLTDLLDQPPVEAMVDFFDLPNEYRLSRRHDRGTCQLLSSHDGAYIIQTPFYGKGFWSLVLLCVMDSARPHVSIKMSGVIQADKDAELSKIFRKVQVSAKTYVHPMLLPLELYKTHFSATSERFEDVLGKTKAVDERLLAELETKSKPKDANKVYRELSKTLHKCSMELAELGRRREFEEEFGERLKEELQNDIQPLWVATMVAALSKSRGLDMESLPGKIESQRNVLYSLIAQQDNNLQFKLASESLRDSKAMKTLSILTILFLPGAFVATLFSTNMFTFHKEQEIWIYFVIVVPLTALLMLGWVLWLRNTPDGVDVEAGNANLNDKRENILERRKTD